jgi:hypothetical protein
MQKLQSMKAQAGPMVLAAFPALVVLATVAGRGFP